MRKQAAKFWNRLPLGRKILLEVTLMALVLFASNLFIYWQVNRTIRKMNTVYMSNVNLGELSDALSQVQQDMYSYISVQSSKALENYYRSEQEYINLTKELNRELINNPVKILENNIRNMSETYLDITAEAVKAKRGRNVEKYKASYEKARKHYQYITGYISELNNLQFKSNSRSYQTLQQALRYTEVASSALLICIMMLGIAILMTITGDIVTPLTDLAHTAALVGQGCFHIRMPATVSEDEIGILTRTFNQMIGSLEEYVGKIRESAEKEQRLLERELLMETHLKEAQLKYLQSQINPHFLFNSLNAGAQLALMEDAEKTCIFLDKMAEFFRYNVKKGLEDSTVGEEVESAENYIYIMNVRFDGDIHFTTEVDPGLRELKMPSMVLQPIVENSFRHGIRDIEWEGKIFLSVLQKGTMVFISIKDNGRGISRKRMEEIVNWRDGMKYQDSGSNSTGIGINNVKSRLELYYNCKDILSITSEGENKGTEVILRIPAREEKEDVSDFTG